MGTKQAKGDDEEKQSLIPEGLRGWRREHPDVALYEMERETMRRMTFTIFNNQSNNGQSCF